MVELFGIRKPLDGRFAKDSLRPPLHIAPTNTEPTSPGLIWPECFPFSSRHCLPARAKFDHPLFETQIFSLLAAWHSRSHAEFAHIWLPEQPSDIVRSLGRSSPRHAKRNADISRQFSFRFGLNWIVSPSVG